MVRYCTIDHPIPVLLPVQSEQQGVLIMISVGLHADAGVDLSRTRGLSPRFIWHRLGASVADRPTCQLWVYALNQSRDGLNQCLSDLLAFEHEPVWVLDAFPDRATATLVVKAGAKGYSEAPVNSAHLERAYQVMTQGGYWVPRNVLELLVDDLIADESPERWIPVNLSPRERQVARCVADGLSNKRVARELDVTERTVKAHLSNIFQKTQASDRLELALLMKGELPERVRVNLE